MGGTNIDGNKTVQFCITSGAATANYDGQGWIADGDYELVSATMRSQVTSSVANAEIQIYKAASGTAKASGTKMLVDPGFETTYTANTNQAATVAAARADRRVTSGQLVAPVLDEAATSLAGVTITLKFQALGSSSDPLGQT